MANGPESAGGGDPVLSESYYLAYLFLSQGLGYFLRCSVDGKIAAGVHDGSLILDLVKPLDYQLGRFCRELGEVIWALPALSLGVLLAWQVHGGLSLGRFLVFVISVGNAYVLLFSYAYIVGILSFRTTSIWGLTLSRRVLSDIFSGVLFPLSLVPDWLAGIGTFLPFRFIIHFPVSVFLQRGTLAEVITGLSAQLGWILVLVSLTRLLWRQNFRHLTAGGG